MENVIKSIFRETALSINIRLTDEQEKKFFTYLNLLKEYAKIVNITRITKDEDILLKHFVDSLSCILAIESLDKKKVIDIGSGAGFPSLPLKIYQNNFSLTLVDARKKCTDFLNILVEKLKIKDIEIINQRAEDLGHNMQYRENFDIVLSRAVAKMPTLVEYTLPFLKTGGIFIAQKGKIDDELEKSNYAISLLGGKIKNIINVKIPGLNERHLIVIEKVKNTPSKFPRRPGIPSKRPILHS